MEIEKFSFNNYNYVCVDYSIVRTLCKLVEIEAWFCFFFFFFFL